MSHEPGERERVAEIVAEHAIDFQGVERGYKGTASEYIADRILAALRSPGEPERRYTLEEVADMLASEAQRRNNEPVSRPTYGGHFSTVSDWLRALPKNNAG